MFTATGWQAKPQDGFLIMHSSNQKSVITSPLNRKRRSAQSEGGEKLGDPARDSRALAFNALRCGHYGLHIDPRNQHY